MRNKNTPNTKSDVALLASAALQDLVVFEAMLDDGPNWDNGIKPSCRLVTFIEKDRKLKALMSLHAAMARR